MSTSETTIGGGGDEGGVRSNDHKGEEPEIGPAYQFTPTWRTTKTHSVSAMMDCYRLVYFAFSQPRVISSPSSTTPPQEQGKDSSTNVASTTTTTTPSLTSRRGMDALYSRHKGICNYRNNDGTTTTTSLHSPLSSLPMLCGTIYDDHGDENSLIGHIPYGFVEELFQRVGRGFGGGGGDVHHQEPSSSSSTTIGSKDSPIESLDFDSERGVGSVLFRSGFLGEQCYLAHHLSMFNLPTKAALRRGLAEGAPLGISKGVPTTIPVTLFMEFAYCLPFVNPCLLQLHKDAGTLNRHLFRTFPMPFESHTEYEGATISGTTVKSPLSSTTVLNPVRNGKDVFAGSRAHRSCIQTTRTSTSGKRDDNNGQVSTSTTTAALLGESKWIARTDTHGTVYHPSSSTSISLPHNEHWYHGIPAQIQQPAKEYREDATIPSASVAANYQGFVIERILRNPVIPQALVETLLALDDGKADVTSLCALCQLAVNQNNNKSSISVEAAPVAAILPPISCSIMDLWVGYVCRYVLWKPTATIPSTSSTSIEREGTTAENRDEGEGTTTHRDEEEEGSKQARNYYQSLLGVISQQPTTVQTLTAQSIVYMAASEALSLLDHNTKQQTAAGKGEGGDTATHPTIITHSLIKMITKTAAAQSSGSSSVTTTTLTDPLGHVIHLLDSTTRLILETKIDEVRGDPCLEHLHDSLVLPFQGKGPSRRSPPSSSSTMAATTTRGKQHHYSTNADKSSVVIVCEMLREYIADPLKHSIAAFVNYKLRLQLDPSIACITADVKIQVARKLRLEKALELTLRSKEVLQGGGGEKNEKGSEEVVTVAEKVSIEDSAAIRAYVANQLAKLVSSNRGDDGSNNTTDNGTTATSPSLLVQYYIHKSREVIGVDLAAENGKVPQLPFFAESLDVMHFLSTTSLLSLAFNCSTIAEVLRREGLLLTGNKEDDNVYVAEEGGGGKDSAAASSSSKANKKPQRTVFQDPLDPFSQVTLLFDKHASSGTPASLAAIACSPADFFIAPSSPSNKREGGGKEEEDDGAVVPSYAGVGGRLREEARRYQGPLGGLRLFVELLWEIARIPIMVIAGFLLIAMAAVYLLPGGGGGGADVVLEAVAEQGRGIFRSVR